MVRNSGVVVLFQCCSAVLKEHHWGAAAQPLGNCSMYFALSYEHRALSCLYAVLASGFLEGKGQCQEAVMGWMRASKLALNPDMMEVLMDSFCVQEMERQLVLDRTFLPERAAPSLVGKRGALQFNTGIGDVP